MKYSYTQFDSSLSLAMLEQILQNQNIRLVLTEIAAQLRRHILPVLIEQESSGLSPKLGSLAMQHSSGDKFVGALLPDYTPDYLEHTAEGRMLLLTTIDNCLQAADKISTPHEFLALMKVIDGMAFVYDVFETKKVKPDDHLRCKDYIAPTPEETGIRSCRSDDLLAMTYGIGTEMSTDLVVQNKKLSTGCFSGKARFFILPTESRTPIWFEKLADQRSVNKPVLPLIASPSNSAAKNFIMAHGLGLFRQENGLFDMNKAQIFANCLMAYLVYCGHHSFLEVVEIWNRQLDFLVIEKPEQLPPGTIPGIPTILPYMDEPEAVERKLPYARVGKYSSFLHPLYADKVIQCAKNHLINGVDLSFNVAHSYTGLGTTSS